MKLRNGTYHLIKSAIADFKRNKIRTFLTSLGITIGVMSVVMLIALGLGLKNYISEQFEGLGANLIMVMGGSGLGGGGDEGGGFSGPAGMFGSVIEFDERDVSSLRRIQEIEYVVPTYFKSLSIEAEDNEETGYVMGVNEEFFGLMNSEMLEGNVFDKSDLQGRTKVAVLGHNLSENLFGEAGDGAGRTIRVDNMRLKVIGVLEKTGDREMDKAAVIPYTTTFASLNPDKTFWSIYLGVTSEDDVETASEKAEETLLKRYKEDEFSITEQSEILSTVNQIFAVLNAILVAIGSISLLVGGIGIMNIMYATVTERTKEIGIRRAIGATKKDILVQFLAESVVLSTLGGLVGLLLSVLIVMAIRIFFPAAINTLAVVIAFGVSGFIGVFFGVFPAKRAADLPPIVAIKYE
ncbi:ABC transporter permease [Patescibacteria group bacterium]|nr:ABC transporter permease [Patescibacteria group bacterium]MBU1256221.1 ABC transporter permease [Patescibacteria group bacterium]MBU1457761.1 ABC transporter permease [Patescibacteria group bacterium]